MRINFSDTFNAAVVSPLGVDICCVIMRSTISNVIPLFVHLVNQFSDFVCLVQLLFIPSDI